MTKDIYSSYIKSSQKWRGLKTKTSRKKRKSTKDMNRQFANTSKVALKHETMFNLIDKRNGNVK